MSTFISLLVYGTADGAILALAALGFVLIYKSTGVINFAQGEFLLVGAYVFYTAFVLLRLPMVLAVVFGAVVATILAVLIERVILRPMVGESAISIIMVTIGLSMFLKAVVQMFYGTSPKSQPALLPDLGLVPPVPRSAQPHPRHPHRRHRAHPVLDLSPRADTGSRCGRSPTTSRPR